MPGVFITRIGAVHAPPTLTWISETASVCVDNHVCPAPSSDIRPPGTFFYNVIVMANGNSNTNNNNQQCMICLARKKNSRSRCLLTCKGKMCNSCTNVVKGSTGKCPTCREMLGPPPSRSINYRRSRQYAAAANQVSAAQRLRRARAAAAEAQRGAFQEPRPRVRLTRNEQNRLARALNRNLQIRYPSTLVERMHQRSGSTSPPPRVRINNPRGRRSGAPSPEPRPMHTGGLVRKTGPHRLLKDEIVLSRAQRRGLTHGQIVKILKSYRKSK